MLLKTAVLGLGTLDGFVILVIAYFASFPVIRITATPHLPCPINHDKILVRFWKLIFSK